jgi:aminoglycoside 3-N-acetyltransferase I
MTEIVQLTASDAPRMRALNLVFSRAFEDPENYEGQPPEDAYLARMLAKPHVIVLVALSAGEVVAGLVAYELDKLEQARSEIYIYDLAVEETHRRQRLATALIGRLQEIATERGAWVVYVQADYGDDPAIALYTKLGEREDVLHFDIPPA